jgi:hypothetical protein
MARILECDPSLTSELESEKDEVFSEQATDSSKSEPKEGVVDIEEQDDYIP